MKNTYNAKTKAQQLNFKASGLRCCWALFSQSPLTPTKRAFRSLMVRQPTSRPAYPHTNTHTHTPTYRQPPHHANKHDLLVYNVTGRHDGRTDWLTDWLDCWRGETFVSVLSGTIFYAQCYILMARRVVLQVGSDMHKKVTWGRAIIKQQNEEKKICR